MIEYKKQINLTKPYHIEKVKEKVRHVLTNKSYRIDQKLSSNDVIVFIKVVSYDSDGWEVIIKKSKPLRTIFVQIYADSVRFKIPVNSQLFTIAFICMITFIFSFLILSTSVIGSLLVFFCVMIFLLFILKISIDSFILLIEERLKKELLR